MIDHHLMGSGARSSMNELSVSDINTDMRNLFPIGIETYNVTWRGLRCADPYSNASKISGGSGDADADGLKTIVHQSRTIEGIRPRGTIAVWLT